MKSLLNVLFMLVCIAAVAELHAACPHAGGSGGGGGGGGYGHSGGGSGGGGIWKKRARGGKSKVCQSFKSISIAKLVSEMKKGNVVLIDARSTSQYGDKHIAGAKKYSKGALPADKSKTIVVYADNKKSSETKTTAQKIAKLKYKNVLVYQGGINEWRRRGGPCVEGQSAGEFKLGKK